MLFKLILDTLAERFIERVMSKEWGFSRVTAPA